MKYKKNHENGEIHISKSHTKNMSKIGEEKETTISSFYPPFFLSFLLSLVNSKMPTFAKLFFLQTSSSPPFLLFKKTKKGKLLLFFSCWPNPPFSFFYLLILLFFYWPLIFPTPASLLLPTFFFFLCMDFIAKWEGSSTWLIASGGMGSSWNCRASMGNDSSSMGDQQLEQ